MQVKGVIFDCDGTLLDSMGIWQSLETKIAERAGLVLTSEERVFLNSNTPVQTANYFHEHYGVGASQEEVLSFMDDVLEAFYRYEVEARRGAVALVEELKQRKIHLTVVSSSPGKLLRLGLERVGIYDCFEEVISSCDMGISKRGPLAVRHAQHIMHTEAEETWGFEDSLYAAEVLAGQHFGAVGIYDTDAAGTVEQLEQVCDVVVNELDELDIDRFVAGSYRRTNSAISAPAELSNPAA